MDSMDRRLMLAGAGLAGVAVLSRVGKAGPLGPPHGPVSPRGKTIQQVSARGARRGEEGTPEARLPVQGMPSSQGAQFVISQPGAYYLAGNIFQEPGRVCIDIQCDDVDIDGGGFAFIGGSAGARASCIRAVGRRALEIYDCAFKGWQGCCCDCDDCDDVFISDCLFHECVNPPDPVGGGGEVARCRDGCEFEDIDVRDCVGSTLRARHNTCFGCVVCVGGTTPYVQCADACCIEDSLFSNSASQAVVCGNRCQIEGNKVSQCYGLYFGSESLVCDNEISVPGGPALTAGGGRTCIEDNLINGVGPGGGCIDVLLGGDGALIDSNHVTVDGGVAIHIAPGVTGCHVQCNCVRSVQSPGLPDLILIPPGNSYGPIVSVAQAGDVSGIPNAGHPWANFLH